MRDYMDKIKSHRNNSLKHIYVKTYVKTIANSAKCCSVSNFGDNDRYLSYKYNIGNHV